MRMPLPRFTPRTDFVWRFVLVIAVTYGLSELFQSWMPRVPLVIWSPEVGQTVTTRLDLDVFTDFGFLVVAQSLLVYLLLARQIRAAGGTTPPSGPASPPALDPDPDPTPAAPSPAPSPAPSLAPLSPRAKTGASLALVIGVIVNAMAHTMHVVCNKLEHSARVHADGVYGTIYFFDEYLGHALILVALFFWFGALLLVEPGLPEPSAPPVLERVLLGLLAVAFGVVEGLAAIEGQSGLIAVGLTAGIMGPLLALQARGDRPVSTFPFRQFVLVVLLAITATVVGWGLGTGFLPHYPFLVQPSQL